MTMIAYRIQSIDRNVTDLLDPEQQLSWPADGGAPKHGVSGCETPAELAAYLAVACPPMDGAPVLVEIEGPESDDEPEDVELGEVLVLPTRAAVIDGDAFFEAVGELVDARMMEGLELDELVERAEDMLG